MKLRDKLLVLILIPLLGMLAFALTAASARLRETREMSALMELSRVSVRIGLLVHDLQKERGMSAGFIGSGGKRFQQELEAQRAAVDQRHGELVSLLQTLDEAAWGEDFRERLGQFSRRMQQLPATRREIGDLRLAVGDAVAYYNGNVSDLLAIVGQSAVLSRDAGITRLATAYAAFLQGKEAAGLERAMLSNILGADRFTPESLSRLLAVSSAQETWLKVFATYALPAQRELLAQKLAAPVVAEVGAIRQAALERMQAPSLGMDPVHWFGKATARIELLKEVEDRLAEDLMQAARDAEASARQWLGLSAALTLMALVVSLFVARRLIAGILGQIGGEPGEAVRIAQAIAEGQLDNEIPVRSGDRHSLFADMQRMQSQLKARIAAEREAAEVNQRIRIALDHVSTGVMIANNDREIIYVNKSVVRILRGAEAGIRRQLPEFSADGLLGTCIDRFHRVPAHQAELLAGLREPHVAQLLVGDSHLTVTANPVISETGERLGTIAEWVDRTAEVHVEQEIEQIVGAAARGDLGSRIDVARKRGFFAKLGEGTNQLLSTTQDALLSTLGVLERLAAGDLTATIDRDYSGIFGELRDDTNQTVTQLRELAWQIRDAAEAIHTAAREIAAGNQDLSARTEEQASSLEETASSMEELNATVRQNAEHSRQAVALAERSNAIASQGGDLVRQVVARMGAIEHSSHRISDIIGVIDGIAFQTNLLALNAAVEAARAGEQGRGFAVVATEVRNLAQRSASAAREIKALIVDSVAEIEQGNRLATQAGETMNEIVSSFRQVVTLVAGISSASAEQSSGIEQVAQAVTQMDEVTQQNAALVEQAAAAAESLEEQARQLMLAVDVFKLPKNATVPAG